MYSYYSFFNLIFLPFGILFVKDNYPLQNFEITDLTVEY